MRGRGKNEEPEEDLCDPSATAWDNVLLTWRRGQLDLEIIEIDIHTPAPPHALLLIDTDTQKVL